MDNNKDLCTQQNQVSVKIFLFLNKMIYHPRSRSTGRFLQKNTENQWNIEAVFRSDSVTFPPLFGGIRSCPEAGIIELGWFSLADRFSIFGICINGQHRRS